MRDGTGEWNAGESGRPLRVKLQRGATGVNKDLYATIEWFYCQGTGDEHGKVSPRGTHCPRFDLTTLLQM